MKEENKKKPLTEEERKKVITDGFTGLLMSEFENREGGMRFVKWLLGKTDIFDAPLVLPEHEPEILPDGQAFYKVGGTVQAGYAILEASYMIREVDKMLTPKYAKAAGVTDSTQVVPDEKKDGFDKSSIILCSLSYALEATNRFTLDDAHGYIDNNTYLLPPGIHRGVYIASRLLKLTEEEIFGMCYAYPFDAMYGKGPRNEKKDDWYGSFIESHHLSYVSMTAHKAAIESCKKRVAVEKKKNS